MNSETEQKYISKTHLALIKAGIPLTACHGSISVAESRGINVSQARYYERMLRHDFPGVQQIPVEVANCWDEMKSSRALLDGGNLEKDMSTKSLNCHQKIEAAFCELERRREAEPGCFKNRAVLKKDGSICPTAMSSLLSEIDSSISSDGARKMLAAALKAVD